MDTTKWRFLLVVAFAWLPAACAEEPEGSQQQGNNGCPPGGGNLPAGATPGRCWAGAITFNFNRDMDVALDRAGGPAARAAAFQAAAATWNQELAFQGIPVNIQVVDFQAMPPPGGVPMRASYGADQGAFFCVDQVARPVYDRSFGPIHNHSGDVANAASFGHHVNAGAGPGWTASISMGMSDESMDVLAWTATLPPPPAAMALTEADIVFNTHTKVGMNCQQISWQYTLGDGGSYDYYSVALHELGHALGLDDRANPADANNVMRPTIFPGQCLKVTDQERMLLAANCGVPFVPNAPPNAPPCQQAN